MTVQGTGSASGDHGQEIFRPRRFNPGTDHGGIRPHTAIPLSSETGPETAISISLNDGKTAPRIVEGE